MTPNTLKVLIKSIETCLDKKTYNTNPNEGGYDSEFMCVAFIIARNCEWLSEEERDISKKFLNRWMRNRNRQYNEVSDCLVTLLYHRKFSYLPFIEFRGIWETESLGEKFYQELLVTLREKLSKTSQ